MVVTECNRGNEQVIRDARRIAGEEGTSYSPTDPREVRHTVNEIESVANISDLVLSIFALMSVYVEDISYLLHGHF